MDLRSRSQSVPSVMGYGSNSGAGCVKDRDRDRDAEKAATHGHWVGVPLVCGLPGKEACKLADLCRLWAGVRQVRVRRAPGQEANDPSPVA